MREHTDIITEPDNSRISEVRHSNGSLQSVDSDRQNDVISSAEMADTLSCDTHSSDPLLNDRVSCTTNNMSLECKTTEFDHCKGFSLSVGRNSKEKLLHKSIDDSELCEDNDVDICDEGSSDGVNDDEVLGLLTCEGKTFHDAPETVTPNAESRYDSNENSVKCCNDGLVCSNIDQVGFSKEDSFEHVHSGIVGLDLHGNKETSASDRSVNILMREKSEYEHKVNDTELDQTHFINTDGPAENSFPCNFVDSDLTEGNALPNCEDKDNIRMYCPNHDDTEGQKYDNRDCREIDDNERDDAFSTDGDNRYDDNDVEQDDDKDDENDGLPIDRGWAWMITLGTFILFLLIPGYNNVLAVLFLDIVEYYETSVTAVTIMQSACCLAYSILCQLTVHMLLKRFSVRLVTTVAALVNASATLLVLASNNMAVFALLQVVKFAAHGAILTPSLALVGLYFKRRRALASSIALLGLSFASVLAPLMIRYLRQEYGFKGCFLIMSGYELHGIVATSLLRPLSYYRKRNNKRKYQIQTLLNSEDSKNDNDTTTSNYKQSKKSKCCLTGIAESGQSTDCSDENVGLLARDCVGDKNGSDHQGKTVLQNGSLEIVPNLNYTINGVNGMSSNSNICIEISDINHTDGQCLNKGKGRAVDQFLYKLLHPLQRENATSTITISEVCEHKSHELCHCPTNRTMVLTPKSKDIDNTNCFSGQNYFTGSCDFIHNARHRNNGLPVHDTLSNMSSRYHSVNSISKKSYVSARMSTLELTPSMMCSTLNVDEVCMTTHDPQHKSDTPKTNQNLCMEVFRSVFNFSAFKNWSCVALILSYILARSGTLIIIYLPSYATQSGLPQQEAAILVTVFGAVDMFSRVAFGFFGDLHLIRPKYIIATTATIIGILSCFVGFFQSFQTLLFYSATLGLIGVVTLSLNTTNIIDIAGLDMLGPLLALGSLLLTLSNTFQFPILGLLIETTGSFLPVFYYAAVSYLLAVVLLVTEAPIQRLWKRHTDVSLPE